MIFFFFPSVFSFFVDDLRMYHFMSAYKLMFLSVFFLFFILSLFVDMTPGNEKHYPQKKNVQASCKSQSKGLMNILHRTTNY